MSLVATALALALSAAGGDVLDARPASAARSASRAARTGGRRAPPAQPVTAIDAERAFAADAQAVGQWTAFRQWSTPDAIMFWPQPGNVHDTIRNWPDPARAVRWWPTAAWLSCDGKTAVTTGGSLWPDGRHGYFTTVWARQPDGGWRWVLDHGDFLTQPRPMLDMPTVATAKCLPVGARISPPPRAPVHGAGGSPDHSLVWRWEVQADGRRELSVSVLEGEASFPRYRVVLDDRVAAP